MKIALISDDLVQSGGQELVFTAISDTFPNAPIYTSVASNKWRKYFSDKGRKLITSYVQGFPFIDKIPRYYAPFLAHNIGFENFDLSEYDLVLSSSSRFSHHVVTKPSTKHICYMHSPGRMLWEPLDYFKYETFGILGPFKKLANGFLGYPLTLHRMLDYAAAHRVDKFVANSVTVQNRIKKFYHLDSDLLYPFVDTDKFTQKNTGTGDYFIVITRLVAWKRVDLAIEACKQLGKKLLIVGTGPDLPRLKTIARGSNTTFVGRVGDAEKISLLQKSLALIMTQKEDFGIVPLEAMAAGKPVLAFGEGGVLETVINGETGSFFSEQSAQSLVEAIQKFDPREYKPDRCRQRALEFDRSVFISKMKQLVESSS